MCSSSYSQVYGPEENKLETVMSKILIHLPWGKHIIT